MIIGIVAIAKNYAIGRDGKLPWHYPADLKFFKGTTLDQSVVMGSNTWRSIGKPLPNRTNIVLSRTGNIEVPKGVKVFDNERSPILLASKLEVDLYVIGGAAVFAAYAEHIGKWVVTDVPIDVPDADTFMPSDFLNRFELESTRDLDDGLMVRFLTRTC